MNTITLNNTWAAPCQKPTIWHVRPAKTQISLGIRLVWSESSLSAWRKLGYLATHWAHSEDSDQTGRMPKLIWICARRTVVLLVLSWGDSRAHQSPFLYPPGYASLIIYLRFCTAIVPILGDCSLFSPLNAIIIPRVLIGVLVLNSFFISVFRPFNTF